MIWTYEIIDFTQIWNEPMKLINLWCGSLIVKCSCWTKVEMAMVKVERLLHGKLVRPKSWPSLWQCSNFEVLPRSFPKHPKAKGKRPLGPLTQKVGNEGHQQEKSLPKRKPPRIVFMWWNNFNLSLIPQSQTKRKKRTQKWSIFQKRQLKHPSGQRSLKEPKRLWS